MLPVSRSVGNLTGMCAFSPGVGLVPGRGSVALFTDIVSLGYRCRTTHRLKQHFGFDRAFPFDWWVTPLKGATSFLEDWDVDALYDPDVLHERYDGDHLVYLKHERYGIKLRHEFPNRAGAKSVTPAWRECLDDARARTRHLMDRFERLNQIGRRVLFVRELDPREERIKDHARPLRELIRHRMPAAKTSFLLISPSGANVDGWTSLKIDDPKRQPWEGNQQLWDAALSSLGFNGERRERKHGRAPGDSLAGEASPAG